jgi:sirohydrochlorin ferrochelatase
MTAYIVFAHGSSVESANAAVRRVAAEAARRAGWSLHGTAFLGGGIPNLPDAAAAVVQDGATEIVVIPYFLTSGLHLDRDLPDLLAQVQKSHPRVSIRATGPLDGHPGLVQAVLDRANDDAENGD